MAISVIIPVLSDPEGLNKTLLCFRAMDLAANDELIIANDGADKACAALLDSYKDLPLKSVEIQKSRGSYHARNQALRFAANEKILFVDAGLTLVPDTLQRMSALLSQFDYVAGNVKVEKQEEESLGEKYYRLTAFPMEDMFRRYHAGGAGFLGVNKSLMEKIGDFDEELFSGADNEFGMRVFRSGFTQHFESRLSALHRSRNWSSQFRVWLRILKGRQQLSRKYPSLYADMRINLSALFRFPFTSVKSILRSQRKRVMPAELGRGSWLLATSIHHAQVFSAMLLILIFPKKNFNLR